MRAHHHQTFSSCLYRVRTVARPYGNPWQRMAARETLGVACTPGVPKKFPPPSSRSEQRHLCVALLSFRRRVRSWRPLELPSPKTGHSGGSCSNLDVLRPRSEAPRVRVELAAETDDERKVPARGRSQQQRKSGRHAPGRHSVEEESDDAWPKLDSTSFVPLSDCSLCCWLSASFSLFRAPPGRGRNPGFGR